MTRFDQVLNTTKNILKYNKNILPVRPSGQNIWDIYKNKIEGTPILKIAMVNYSSKFDKKIVKKKL